MATKKKAGKKAGAKKVTKVAKAGSTVIRKPQKQKS